MSRLYLSKPCAFSTTHCTWQCGRCRRPAFPAPSVRERDNEMHSSGENRTVRTLEHAFYSLVIPGRRAAASPESITTPRLRLAAFAELTKGASGPRAKRAGSMDSGLAPRGAPRNDDGECFANDLRPCR